MKNREIIEKLLEIGAVELRHEEKDWFTWTSGIKSPIYCDNRLTLSYPNVRELIAKKMAKSIEENFSGVDIIAGTATAGIPHATLVSDILKKPMIYVRDKAKGHGKTNQIEGRIEKNASVVLIEDLISTGKSSINAAKALIEAGFNLVGVISIFSYNLESAKKAFEEMQINYLSLSDYDELIEVSK